MLFTHTEGCGDPDEKSPTRDDSEGVFVSYAVPKAVAVGMSTANNFTVAQAADAYTDTFGPQGAGPANSSNETAAAAINNFTIAQVAPFTPSATEDATTTSTKTIPAVGRGLASGLEDAPAGCNFAAKDGKWQPTQLSLKCLMK